MPKHKMFDLLYELMLDSKRSDRELAKAIGVSQPTVTRMRKNLENQGFIREYTVMPSLEKLGFEILALNFVKADFSQDLNQWITMNQKILFACLGGGFDGYELMLVTVHKDFTDFSNFINDLKNVLGQKNPHIRSFLSSLNSNVVKHLSLKNLERASRFYPVSDNP